MSQAGAVFAPSAASGGLHKPSASALLWAASPGRGERESRCSTPASFLVLLYLFLKEDEDKLRVRSGRAVGCGDTKQQIICPL